MKNRTLGKLEISPVGMGCMAFSHGYGAIPEEQYSIEAIRGAFSYGCNFFDTAEVYSPGLSGIGHNELIVGKALRDVRSSIKLATKLFINKEEAQKSVYDAVKRHLVGSLNRLQTDFIDLYYLHRSGGIDIEAVADAMGRLINEGLIGGWGLSQVDTDVIAKAHNITPVTAVQNIYSMVERDSEKSVIPYCMEHGIGFVPFSPVASGLLSGKITTETQFESYDDVRNWVPQLKKENIAGNQPIVDMLRGFACRKHATCAQISLAWMLHKYPNLVPIPGSKNKERIIENLGSWNVELTHDEFITLENRLNSLKVYGHRGFDR